MRILLVDDDDLSRDVMKNVIHGLMGHEITESKDANEAFEMFRKDPFPIVVSDIRMPGKTGIDLLKNIKDTPEGQKCSFILMTGYADLESTITAVKYGASDYLRKPIDNRELMDVIRKVVTQQSLNIQDEYNPNFSKETGVTKEEPAILEDSKSTLNLSDGTKVGLFSTTLRSLAELAIRYHEDRDVPVLIEGPTGTGKELFAKIIHYGKEGNDLPFITVNCAAISESLYESELFGYVGGAFTGALPKGAIGKLEAANGGTIFLDEVGEIPLPMQAKLLRALQEYVITRVGSVKNIPLDLRVICATNRNLGSMIKEGMFRQDLYFRINVGKIELPPLSRQTNAIVPLAQMFLRSYSTKKEKLFQSISKSCGEMLESYDWPGNIRELKNTIEQAVLIYDDVQLQPEHISSLDFSDILSEHQGITVNDPVFIKLPEDRLDLENLNVEIVRKVLEKFSGNKSKTAEYLGLSLSALRSRIKKL